MRSTLMLGLALLANAGCGADGTGPALIVGPAGANTFDELWVQADDDSPDKYTYQWSVDGEEEPDLTGMTVPSEYTRKGEEWTVTVTKGNKTSTATIEIGNALPSAEVSIDPANPTANDAVTATGVATDPDNDPAYVEYTWQRWEEETQSWEGANFNNRTLPVDATRRGERWRVVVTPLDGDSEGPIGFLEFEIANALPLVTELTLNQDTASTEDTLTVTAAATDADPSDSVTLEYQWVLNGTEVAGQTGRSYDGSGVDGFDAGDQVYVKVRGNDGEAGPWRASPIVQVVNGAPSAPGAAIEPEEPLEDDDLVCVRTMDSVDPDPGDTVSYQAMWTVNGAPFAGGDTTDFTNDTVPSDITAPDDVWECTLVASDALGNQSSAVASVEVAPLSGCLDGTSEVVWDNDTVGCLAADTITWAEARDNAADYCNAGWEMAGASVVNAYLNGPGYTDDWEFAFNGEGCAGDDHYATTNDSSWRSYSSCVWRRSHHTRLSSESSSVDGVMCVRSAPE